MALLDLFSLQDIGNTGYYRTTLSVQQPESKKDKSVELSLMGGPGDMMEPHDGVLPPIQPGMKKVESTSEIMNLTLHQVNTSYIYITCNLYRSPGKFNRQQIDGVFIDFYFFIPENRF